MTITYAWTIQRLDRRPTDSGKQDVVTNVNWRLDATDGLTPPHTAFTSGDALVALDPDSPDFTPYDDLTETQVLGWVTTALGDDQVTAIQATLSDMIGAQIAPVIISADPPWVSPPDPE